MKKVFQAVCEDKPGDSWLAHFREVWPTARPWYLKEGAAARPTATAGRAALREHMPELVPIYDSLCGLVGDDEIAHRFLTLYNPPPVIVGCSQAVWLGAGGPALIRNYDFDPDFTTGRIEATRWFGGRCIVMSEAAWGCLDGMNQDGLAISLTFGGRKAHGKGFPVVLVLRYVLETSRTVKEAIATLCRIPLPMSQNVTVLDRTGAYATILLGADREPAVTDWTAVTNHQETIDWPESVERSRSVERHACLSHALNDRSNNFVQLSGAFMRPPLYNLDFENAFVTMYTAIYWPAQGAVEYRWPGKCWPQRFDRFEEGSYEHDFGANRDRAPESDA